MLHNCNLVSGRGGGRPWEIRARDTNDGVYFVDVSLEVVLYAQNCVWRMLMYSWSTFVNRHDSLWCTFASLLFAALFWRARALLSVSLMVRRVLLSMYMGVGDSVPRMYPSKTRFASVNLSVCDANSVRVNAVTVRTNATSLSMP